MISIQVCADMSRGIGKNGKMPWCLPGEMKAFKQLTTYTEDPNKITAVIMGRKTWESIPQSQRPLRNRLNIILSRDPSWLCGSYTLNQPTVRCSEHREQREQREHREQREQNVHVCGSFESALEFIYKNQIDKIERIWVIGGAEIYKEALKHVECIYYTKIFKEFDCDTFFPPLDGFELVEDYHKDETIVENGIPYKFMLFKKCSLLTTK